MMNALTGYRSADPWPLISATTEGRVDELLASQEASCRVLAALIADTRAALAALTFPLGFPAPGYDQQSAFDLLGDLMPAPMDRRDEERAWEIACAEEENV